MHRLIDGLATILAAGFLLAAVFLAHAHAGVKDDAVIVTADPIVYLDIGGEGSCTGFVAKVFGHKAVVSAGHCAEEGKVVKATDSIGREFAVHMAYVDKVHDLSIFVPDAGVVAGPITAAPIACDVSVQVGDDISMIGYPVNFGKVTTFGKVAALPSPWQDMWPEVYRLNVFGGPGNSGSPVFNAAGQVIAILVGGDPSYIGMSMAVPVSELCRPSVI